MNEIIAGCIDISFHSKLVLFVFRCCYRMTIGECSLKMLYNRKSVYMRPVIFKKTWPDVAPVEGESIVLECQAKGVPEPEVTWYRDDYPIFSNEKFKVLNDKVIPCTPTFIETLLFDVTLLFKSSG